jgi:hypothetical protein
VSDAVIQMPRETLYADVTAYADGKPYRARLTARSIPELRRAIDKWQCSVAREVRTARTSTLALATAMPPIQPPNETWREGGQTVTRENKAEVDAAILRALAKREEG